jgi:hypothetical protein
MKKSVNIKFLGFLVALFLCLSQVEARDIYVSPNGASGTSDQGATAAAPVNYTRLLAILNAVTSSSENTWNVYFAGGTYYVTASFSMFDAAAYNGKTVTFLGTGTPTIPAIFDGSGNNQMLSLTRSRTSSNAFSFTMRNIVMKNFSNNNNANNTSAGNIFFTADISSSAFFNASYNIPKPQRYDNFPAEAL